MMPSGGFCSIEYNLCGQKNAELGFEGFGQETGADYACIFG